MIVSVSVSVCVQAHSVVTLLLRAEGATFVSAADAGAVEVRVVRAEVAATAVPERGHDCSGKVGWCSG